MFSRRMFSSIQTFWIAILCGAASCVVPSSSAFAADAPKSSAPAVTADPAHKWDTEIQEFLKADRAGVPNGPGWILFTGSSSIRLWNHLPDAFPEHKVLSRGFGGSQMSDLLFFCDQIVLPYKPRHVLVYEGDNDLAAGKSPTEIRDGFAQFVKQVQKALPRTRVSYLAIKPSKARWQLLDKVRATNTLIQEFAKSQKRVDVIDTFSPLLAPDGQLRIDLFREDGLHLNEKGYAVWTQAIAPHLKGR